MSGASPVLAELAQLSGIELAYTDAFGRHVQVPAATLLALLEAMGIAVGSEPQIAASLAEARALAAAPRPLAPQATRAWTCDDLGLGRAWGLSAQLYGLASRDSWGIGDFGLLARLAETAAGLGAAALGLNPLHALFTAAPALRSPYSPSSRRFLNPLYIDLGAVPEHRADDVDPARLAAVRAGELIEYPAVAEVKLAALASAFARFQTEHLAAGSARAAAFRDFVEGAGPALRDHAVFEVLQAEALRQGLSFSWRDWPAELRDPASPAVAALAAERPDEVTFHQYLQWLADQQLAAAQTRARAAGMALGLYLDLAVGLNPAGSAAWADQAVVVSGATVGAPPDQFNPQGQDWGLAPFSPRGLAAQGYRSLRADLRANMRHAGALRIDHVMGLQRLFWIPAGAKPAEGAYVRYPLADLLAVVVEESRRARCVVIGEDLGTVPPGFRETMQAAGLLSYRLFYFERDGGGALSPPSTYPADALVAVSTHDLPTLAGFWAGRDLDWRDRLALHADPAEQAGARADRDADRARIEAALAAAGSHPAAGMRTPSELANAVHGLLASAPSRLMMLQLEDALGLLEQANLPGTIDQHPNWRRRLPVPLEALADHRGLQTLATELNRHGRGQARATPEGAAG